MNGHASSFTPRLAAGLLGIFLAAMMAGLNNRVGALALGDVRGALGFGSDAASWLSTAYAAGELIAMPFAAWFAAAFSLRRFHLLMLAACATFAAILPFVGHLGLMIALRFLQGLTTGTLIPLLMAAALRFLPLSIRLYALALYAMTATFAPNVAIWLTGLWADHIVDLRLVYWQVIPLALLAAALVAWGIPQDASQPERFKHGNWFGMCFGSIGLGLIAVGIDQGNRLEWFDSGLIVCALLAGLACFTVYLLSEWYHTAPFIKLQLLQRRNLGLGFTIFFTLLVVFQSGSLVPITHLGRIWDYRALQSAPIGLIIGLPQLLLSPLVSLALYQRWVDARHVMAAGLGLIAVACFQGSRLNAEWMAHQFLDVQLLQAFGQPMAVVAMLFLSTSVVKPAEGPYVAGTVNTLRGLGTLVGAGLVGRILQLRERFHSEMLLDSVGRFQGSDPVAWSMPSLTHEVSRQSSVLATADAYRILGSIALLLIPCALMLQHIPAPQVHASSSIR